MNFDPKNLQTDLSEKKKTMMQTTIECKKARRRAKNLSRIHFFKCPYNLCHVLYEDSAVNM